MPPLSCSSGDIIQKASRSASKRAGKGKKTSAARKEGGERVKKKEGAAKKSDIKGGRGQSACANTAAHQLADEIAGLEKELRLELTKANVENMYALWGSSAERLSVSSVGFGGNGEQFCRAGDSGSITAEIAEDDSNVQSVKSALQDIMKLIKTFQQDKRLHS